MSNIRLIFAEEKTEKQLQCFATLSNKIYIEIIDNEFINDYNLQYICLDKKTAVGLVRELKKQIGFLESEVANV